jgi:hypothetical protein
MLTGWNTNKNGNRASPAVRLTIKTSHQLPSADKKRILPELQRAQVVENIAANFVSSGNRDAMIQELCKLAGNDNIGHEPLPQKKKGKTTSQPQKQSQTTSTMMVTSSNRSSTPPAKQPQSCRHCGKFVIHTDGICDVYNVPSANNASSGLTNTPNMSVVFQNIKFDNDNDNLEYLFVNDFGNLDDLTLANFMKFLPAPICTSPVYDVSDDDVAPVQAPDHLSLPPIYH